MARMIERSSEFKRDYKRELKGQHRATIEADLRAMVALLMGDKPLPEYCVDHKLTGGWRTFRDLHLYPDLVLIYKKDGDVNTGSLKLARLGSHSELF